MIKFELITDDFGLTPFTDVSEIITATDQFSEFLAPAKRTHIARLTLANENGEQTVLIDEMWHIAIHLSFGATSALLTGEDYVYRIMMTGKPVTFRPFGTSTEITHSTNQSVVEYPGTDLVSALYQCGKQYLDLIALLPPLGHEKNALIIQEYQQRAAKTLAEYGIST